MAKAYCHYNFAGRQFADNIERVNEYRRSGKKIVESAINEKRSNVSNEMKKAFEKHYGGKCRQEKPWACLHMH